MTLSILRFGNSLSFALFIVSIFLHFLNLNYWKISAQLGVFVLLLTPIARIAEIAFASRKNSKERLRIVMIAALIIMIVGAAALESR